MILLLTAALATSSRGVFSCQTRAIPRDMHMRIGVATLTILELVLILGCRQAAPAAPPQQQIDVVGIRSELLALGQAEGHYLVAHSTYATLEQLQQDGLLRGAKASFR